MVKRRCEMQPILGVTPGLVIALSLLVGAFSTALADWRVEWEKIVAAAKKEGKVTLYIHSAFQPIAPAFMEKYPEIKVVTFSGRGADVGSRIISEARAGKTLADVYIGGPHTVNSMLLPAGVLDPLKEALILPEVLDESKWITGRHRFTDLEGKYNYAFLANRTGETLAYNTRLVNPKDFNSHWDLVDPRWKGKIVSLEPTEQRLGGTMQELYYHPKLGPKYVKKLFTEMDVTLARDPRLITDWLGQARFHICLGCIDIGQAIEQGLPVNVFDTDTWKEGASFSTGGGSISLVKNAPDPNAARVFINWFLSREGQLAVQKLTYPGRRPNSGRIDIPKDMVSSMNRLIPGREYSDASKPEWQVMEPIYDLAKEIMREIKRKK
jgi:iron(III) transport system substrate-binding protein